MIARGDVFIAVDRAFIVVVENIDGDNANVGISQLHAGGKRPDFWVHINNTIKVADLEDKSKYFCLSGFQPIWEVGKERDMQQQEHFRFIGYDRSPTHIVAQFVPTYSLHKGVHHLLKETCELRLARLKEQGLPHEETLRALEQWPDETVPYED